MDLVSLVQASLKPAWAGPGAHAPLQQHNSLPPDAALGGGPAAPPLGRRHYKKDTRFVLDLYTLTFDEGETVDEIESREGKRKAGGDRQCTKPGSMRAWNESRLRVRI